MDENEEIDALFQLPLAGFIAARNAAAARLRAAGASEDAARIKALAKPSAAAWAVNQVYWTDRVAFDALIEAGTRLRAAQRESGGPEAVREAMRQRRDSLAAAVKRAEAALSGSGHGTPTSTVLRISSTFEALASQESPGPPPGRLTADLDPPGFEALAGMAFMAAPPASPGPSQPHSPVPVSSADRSPGDDAAAVAAAGSRALVEAEEHLRRCQDAEDQANAQREAAVRRAEAAEHAGVSARREAERAEQAARAARETLETAQLQVDAARQARLRAEAALEEARTALAQTRDQG